MLTYERAYSQVSKSRLFKSIFGVNAPPEAFREIQYTQTFVGVAASGTPGTYGANSGPTLQTFPSGAIVQGITAAAYQAQTTTGSFAYGPSFTLGRRDLFGLSFAYTNDELITANGLTMAEALLGSGMDTIFPCKALLIPPSQGILCTVASLAPAPDLTVVVVYHCSVPRAAS